MTPQEYSLLTRLVQGCATWKNYVQTLISNPQIVNLSNFGAFVSTANQTNGGSTTANKLILDTVDTANGISLVNNGLVISNSGQYLINWLGQFTCTTGGGSGGNITTWYTVNGVAAPNSSYTFRMPISLTSQVLTNVEDINSLNAGDRIEFYWWTDVSPANAIQLTYTAAGTNPARPASPSAKISISQLNQNTMATLPALPSTLDTQTFEILSLKAAGVKNIPSVLDTATWRRLLIEALQNGGGGGGGNPFNQSLNTTDSATFAGQTINGTSSLDSGSITTDGTGNATFTNGIVVEGINGATPLTVNMPNGGTISSFVDPNSTSLFIIDAYYNYGLFGINGGAPFFQSGNTASGISIGPFVIQKNGGSLDSIKASSFIAGDPSAPPSPVAGQIYFDGTNFLGYDGTTWKQLDN